MGASDTLRSIPSHLRISLLDETVWVERKPWTSGVRLEELECSQCQIMLDYCMLYSCIAYQSLEGGETVW